MRSPSKHSLWATWCGAGSPAGGLLLVIAVAACGAPCAAFGQEKAVPAKAAGVFDDDEKKPGEGKAADASKTGGAKTGDVSDRDSIGFTQENVASQMTELEERMFRLS